MRVADSKMARRGHTGGNGGHHDDGGGGAASATVRAVDRLLQGDCHDCHTSRASPSFRLRARDLGALASCLSPSLYHFLSLSLSLTHRAGPMTQRGRVGPVQCEEAVTFLDARDVSVIITSKTYEPARSLLHSFSSIDRTFKLWQRAIHLSLVAWRR